MLSVVKDKILNKRCIFQFLLTQFAEYISNYKGNKSIKHYEPPGYKNKLSLCMVKTERA